MCDTLRLETANTLLQCFLSAESEDDEEEIDDDDLDLIQENTGIKIKKVKISRFLQYYQHAFTEL